MMTEQLEIDVSPITNDINTSVSEGYNKDLLNNRSKENDDDGNSCESNDDDVASNVSDPIAEILYAESSQTEQEINNEEFGDLESSQKQNRHDSTSEFDARLQPLLKILTNYLQSESEQIAERSTELRSYLEQEEEQEEEEEQEQKLSIQKHYNEQETAISALFADLQSMLEQQSNDNTNTTIVTHSDVDALSKTHSCSCAEISLLAHVHAIKCLMRQILNAQCTSCLAQLRKIITELSLMHNILPDPVLCNLQTQLVHYVEAGACIEPNLEQNTSNKKLDTNLLHIMSLIREYVVILQRELMNATKNFTQRASVITLHFS